MNGKITNVSLCCRILFATSPTNVALPGYNALCAEPRSAVTNRVFPAAEECYRLICGAKVGPIW